LKEDKAGAELAQQRATPQGEVLAAAETKPSDSAVEPVPEAQKSSDVLSEPSSALTISGFYQAEAAYTVSSPDHWSKLRNTIELSLQKKFTEQIDLKVSGRFFYDAVFDVSTFFPERVRKDQELEVTFRETYLDVGVGNFDFRVGRQHIIWGEVVGLFFADVVSAKDLRETILPQFDYLRIPQWAMRAEYFTGDFKAETIWIPYMTYDEIGKLGIDFYPFVTDIPAGFSRQILRER
jgi:hypothetical protein